MAADKLVDSGLLIGAMTATADAIRAYNNEASTKKKTWNLTYGFRDVIAGMTSTATAAASDILYGKTAYVNGTKITGTIPDGVFTNEVSSLPSGVNSSGTIPREKYLKISKGYYANDAYYLAQPNSGNLDITTSHSAQTSISVDGKKTITVKGITVPSSKSFSVTNNGTTTVTSGEAASGRTITVAAKATSSASSNTSYNVVTNGIWNTTPASAATTYYGRVTIGPVTGSLGGEATSGSATAAITNTNSIATITDLTGKTAGTDYWQVKATATGTKGGYTPQYTVTTAGWLAETVAGTMADVNVTSDTTGQSIYIPKATLGASGVASGSTTQVTPGALSVVDNETDINGKNRLACSPTSDSSNVKTTYYIAVQPKVAAGTATTNITLSGTSSASVSSAGYAPSTLTGSGSVTGTATAKAKAADGSAWYIPVQSAVNDANTADVELFTTDGSNAGVNISGVIGTKVTTEPSSGYYVAFKGSGSSKITKAGWISTGNLTTATSDTKYFPVTAAAIAGSSTNATATTTVAPGTVSISKQNTPSGVTITNAANGDATTSPTSGGVYVVAMATVAANSTGTTSSISGSGTATVTTAGYAPTTLTGTVSVSGTATAKTSAKNSIVTYIPIKTASPTFKGGAISGTATASSSTGASLSTSTNTSGITIVAAASANRAVVQYNSAVSGWVTKNASDTAYAGTSSATALTSTTYYLNGVTVPSDKSFSVTNNGSVTVTSGNTSAGTLTVKAYDSSSATTTTDKEVVTNGVWKEIAASAATTYYGRVTIASATPTFTSPTPTGSSDATQSGISWATSASSPADGVYVQTRYAIDAATIKYNGAVNGWVSVEDQATAVSTTAQATTNGTKYFISAINVPKSKTFTVTTVANTAADSNALTVTNNAYRKTTAENKANGTFNLTNSGTATISNTGTISSLTNNGTVTALTNNSSKTITTLTNSGTVSTLSNSGTVTVKSSSSSAGTVKINAYNSASTPALTGDKTVVSSGKLVYAVSAKDTASASITTGTTTSGTNITLLTAAPSGSYFTLTANGSGNSKITTAGWIEISSLASASATANYYLPFMAGETKYATTSNQTISTANKYLTSDIVISKLTASNTYSAENIKHGVTISVNNGSKNVFSAEGSYTSDGTITASDILSGKIGYSQAIKYTGNIETLTANDITVADNEITIPVHKYTGTSSAAAIKKSIDLGTVTSGTAQITELTIAYNSTNTNFTVTGSKDVSAPTVGTAGYVSSTKGTRNAKTGGATVSATMPRIALKATSSSTFTYKPVIKRQTFTITGVTDASSGAETTTAPSSGVYVKVSSAANTATATINPGVATAGYGTATSGQYTATAYKPTVGASASDATYIPIKTVTAAISGGNLSGTATATGSSCSISEDTNTSGISIATACSVTRAKVSCTASTAGWASGTIKELASGTGDMTSKTYYINSVTLPTNKSFTINTAAGNFTFTDVDGNVTVQG